MNKTENYTIKVPSIFNAAVDIVLPFHGQYDKVTALIEGIFTFTRSNYYSLYLVDDCSPNTAFLQKISHNARKRNIETVKAMRCSTQRGFAGACQAAFERSENPYVCFINSDCEIDNIGWLRAMGECLLSMKSQGVRMVSARTNNAVHGDPAQQGGKDDVVENVILPAKSHLSLFCFLCHRELFRRCGGFLRNYPFGYYEDEEFAWRMNKHGFKQAVAAKSWVYHEGEATIKTLWSKDAKIRKIMLEENRDRCLQDMH
jgi:GT2 family glycosyltransferase